MTETDVVNFCAMTGNWIEIHSNKHYASRPASASAWSRARSRTRS